MRKATFKYIESELYNYLESKEKIRQMETDIIYKSGGNDENVGGGRSNVVHSVVEQSVIEIDSMLKLKNLKKTVNVIDDIYNRASDPYKRLIELKYFKRHDWDYVVTNLYVGRTSAFRMRKKLIEEIANRLGLV